MSDNKNIASGDIELTDLFSAFARRWYWFVLFAAVGFVIGKWITNRSTLIHKVQSIVLIEDNSERTVYSDNDVPAFNLKYRTKDLESEIAILSSKDLMEKAVLQTNSHVSVFDGPELETALFHSQIPVNIFATPPVGSLFRNVAVDLTIKNANQLELTYQNLDQPIKLHPMLGEEFDFLGSKMVISKKEDDLFWRSNSEFQCTFFLNDLGDMVANMRSKLEVIEANKNTDGVLLILEENLPERGLAIQQALIETYIIEMEHQRKKMANDAFAFIEGRLQMNFGDLDSLEAMIADYKQSRSMALPDKQIEFLYEGIKEFKIELSDAQTQLDIVEQLIANVEENDHEISIPVTTLGVLDPSLNDLIVRLGKLETKRENMKETVHPNNPIFKQLESQIAELKVSMHDDILNFRENMQVFVTDIEGRISAYEKEIDEIGSNNRVLDSMERRRDIMEELYNYLLKRREEAAMVAAGELIDSWVIEKPHVDSSYHNPKKSMIILIGILLALMIPLGFIGYSTLFRKRVSSIQELKRSTSIPIVGTISQVAKRKHLFKKKQVYNNDHFEDFKAIFFNLRFSELKDQVVMFTSSTENEGKTHCAMNFAFTLAALGRKTVLVELDLRKPSFSNRLAIDDTAGVLNILAQTHDISEVTKRTAFSEDLRLITSGASEIDPLKLLMSENFSRFIESLRGMYDHVIIDTPPSLLNSDALIIGRQADLNLFIVRRDYTSKSDLSLLEELHKSERIENMSIIYNGDSSKKKYYGSIAS